MSNLNIIDYPCKKNRCYIQNKKITPIGIQLHSIGTAQGTGKAVADYWNQPSVSAMVNYICDSDVAGRVYKTLPEGVYSWADAGYGNRNLITIEMCESDFMVYKPNSASFTITDKDAFKADIRRSYATAVLLCADICKRHNWNPFTKLPSGLYLISSHNEGRLKGLSSAHVDPDHILDYIDKSMGSFRTDVAAALNGIVIHAVEGPRWYRIRKTWADVKSQLSAYENKDMAIANCPFGYSVFDVDGNVVYSNVTVPFGTQASDFASLSESLAAAKILETVRSCDNSGILYSVTAAQMILESGYVKTELARTGNNCFGMKTTLSGNTWPGSTWDGKSKVNIFTWENYDGKDVRIYADFRKYRCIEDSIKDHAAYLLGAMNGSNKRYKGLTDAKNYTQAITIIKNGGYATDPKYVSKITSIIQRFGLDKYDEHTAKAPSAKPAESPAKAVVYRVQVGLYDSIALAKGWAATVKEVTSFDTFVNTVGAKHQVVCGSFSEKVNAESRAKALINIYGVDAIVKESYI